MKQRCGALLGHAAAVVFVVSLGVSCGAELIPDDQIPTPSKNYVISGGFEPPEGERWQGERMSLDPAAPFAGKHSLRLRGNGQQVLRRDVSVPLETGRTYTLSAWMRSRDLVTSRPGTQEYGVGIMVSDAGWFWQVRIGPAKPTTDWQRYSVTFVAPPTAHYKEQFYQVVALLPANETGELWVDNLQIEAGDRATDFTAQAIPDLIRVVSAANRLHPRLLAKTAVLDRVALTAAAARPLAAECRNMLADLGTVADCARGFETVSDLSWRDAMATFDRVSSRLATSSWTTRWADPWQRYSRSSFPPKLGHADERHVTLGINDYAPVALMVSNLSGSTMEIQAQFLAENEPRSRLLRGPAWVTLRQARMVAVILGKPEEYPTVLSRLDEGHVLTVGAGETAQLWIDVDSAGMQPGDHRSKLVLTPYQDAEPVTIPINVDILPVVLPEKCPAEVFCFGLKPLEDLGERGAKMSIEEVDRIQAPWLKDMVRHGVNRMFHHTQHFQLSFNDDGSLAAPLDFTWHDRFLAVKRRYIPNLAGGYSVGQYNLPKEPDETYERRFAAFMEAWLGRMQDLGVQLENFPLELIDEPSSETLEKNRVAYKVLKRVAPNAKTMAAISMHAPEHLTSIAPIMDIMVVNPDLSPESDKALRETGKEIWTYVCEGSLENLKPYAYYRLLAWKTWSKGYSGFGFTWATYGIEFRSPRSNQYSHFYYGRQGPVPSRGWQGFWRGTRDWAYLHTLRTAAERARKDGRLEAAERGRKLLDQAVGAVLASPDDTALADMWRLRLLTQIQELQR